MSCGCRRYVTEGGGGVWGKLTRVPLVPSIVIRLPILDAKVNTSLQDGRIARIAVDAHPRGRALLGAATAVAAGDAGHGDLGGDTRNVGADDDGTGPVLRVLDVANVGARGGRFDADLGVALAAQGAGLVRLAAALRQASGHDGLGEQENGGELHFGRCWDRWDRVVRERLGQEKRWW